MRGRFTHWMIAVLVLASAARATDAPRPPSGDVVFDVPRVGNIAVDGKLDDWGETGLKILTLSSIKGIPWPRTTPPAGLRLGWNDSGLLLGLTVHHATVHEHDYVRHLFKGDSVEVFVSPKKERLMARPLHAGGESGIGSAVSETAALFFPRPERRGRTRRGCLAI